MALSKRYLFTFAIAAGLLLYLAHQQASGLSLSSRLRYPVYSTSESAPAPYTAAVVYLASVMPGPRSPDRLLQSLPRLQKNIPWRHQWPVLLLHAGMYDSLDSQEIFLNRLRDSARDHELTPEAIEELVRRVEFVSTSHELPPGIPEDGLVDNPIWGGEWPAYHHMCSFFSYKIFNHPRIKDLTYYLRLDDDSYVREPACFDPFEYMHIHNKSYAFRDSPPDMGWVTEGMWPFVSNYAQRHPDVERKLEENGFDWPPNRFWPLGFGERVNFPSYETNFDLVKVPRFRTPEMQDFLSDLASDPKRFYWYRWGDAPIRFAQVSMFLDVAQEAHRMCELPYSHKDRPFDDCECVPLHD
ncbi:Glycosyltransferase family 15 protein [Mycena sanguinolenta]|uniref:Glycosyltransferase family 15 protein n=1 Tax=Mycena sanguinolenta TaxID=230812 RepID=A0A8H6X2X5_9AGAR|nr:Glycosyltransferase family 15 protein [Mycena sanguinolenta]